MPQAAHTAIVNHNAKKASSNNATNPNAIKNAADAVQVSLGKKWDLPPVIIDTPQERAGELIINGMIGLCNDFIFGIGGFVKLAEGNAEYNASFGLGVLAGWEDFLVMPVLFLGGLASAGEYIFFGSNNVSENIMKNITPSELIKKGAQTSMQLDESAFNAGGSFFNAGMDVALAWLLGPGTGGKSKVAAAAVSNVDNAADAARLVANNTDELAAAANQAGNLADDLSLVAKKSDDVAAVVNQAENAADAARIAANNSDEIIASTKKLVDNGDSVVTKLDSQETLLLPAGKNQETLLLPASTEKNPWPYNSEITSRQAGADDFINMVMRDGQTKPGAWGSNSDIPSVDYARNELAITPEFKPSIDKVQRFQIPEGTWIQEGIAGPQTYNGVTYPGGAPQTRILNASDIPGLVPVGEPYYFIQQGVIK